MMNRLPAVTRFGLRAAAHILSPADKRASLLVLMYHRVLPGRDPLLPNEPDAELFAAHMDTLASLFDVMPLPTAVERLKGGSLPARAACITFDDGYANTLEVAAPILTSRRLTATVFVSTGFVGHGRMWNDTLIEVVRAADSELDLSRFGLGRYVLDSVPSRCAAIEKIIGQLKYLEPGARTARVDAIAAQLGRELPDNLMMDEAALRSLCHHGFEIGAHTINHPILTRLGDEEARREIEGSKHRLEEIVGRPVRSFAYPNGRPRRDYDARDVQIVRQCGFDVAVTTAWGAARSNSDVLQIPRLAPWDRSATRFGARLLKAYLDPVADIA
jgi:peptidoglycan/xylan/chitin deacetylase (PgdA/CDA1 family)